jgi:hypothetical protein
MIKFDKPEKLNGEQLRQELKAANVVLPDALSDLFDDGIDGLWLNIADKDESKAKTIIDAHIPKPIPEPTIEQKLASVGLNLEDLKAALGL